MGHPCDDCGEPLDTNISCYEYHLVDTGRTNLCFDCRGIREDNGTFIYSHSEGWAKPPRARLYHYYDGKVWKGGLTHRSSLCGNSKYDKRNLIESRKNLPDDKICKKCLEAFLRW